jgi:hypothetical protein
MKKFQGVRYVARSGNEKIGGKDSNGLDAVYIAIRQSCPTECPFKPVDENQGCWATVGRVGMLNSRLEKEAKGMDRRALGREVAKAIDASWPRGVRQGQMLRLPVAGDLAVPSAVEPVAAAVRRWKKRGGLGAWGYTHAWRRVTRASWGEVSVLASVETLEEAKQARRRGFAPARVVADFPNGSKAWVEEGVKFIPCPEQTREVTCDQCRLCFDDKKLKARGAAIAFKAHSLVKKRTLNVLQEKGCQR